MRLLFCVAMLASILATGGCKNAPDEERAAGQSAAPPSSTSALRRSSAGLPVVTLRIIRADGATFSFEAEVALEGAAQEKGLSGRPPPDPQAAMLFPFRRLTPASFWMKDTPFPLDHLFMRADGTISAILPGKPNDLTPIGTGEPVRAVVQIAGGRAAALGIREGDKVGWGECPGPPPHPPEGWNRLAFCP